MDKQGRCTRLDEFKIGHHYQWIKGGKALGDPRKLVGIRKSGALVFACGDVKVACFKAAWYRRFKEVGVSDGQA